MKFTYTSFTLTKTRKQKLLKAQKIRHAQKMLKPKTTNKTLNWNVD
jgi:hypothetical protein